MIALEILAVLAIAYRIRKRLFTRAEAVVVALVALNLLVIWAQIVIADGVPFPERRYWCQADALLLGWAAWALLALGRRLAARVPRLRPTAPVAIVVVALALLLAALLVKPHVPGSRRHARLQACDWAEARIRADWRGPSADPDVVYSVIEYHERARPSVLAHTGLLPYRLGGRRAMPHKFGAVDLPDYIFDEERKIVFPEGGRYEMMGKARFGRATFALYRRVK